MKILYISHRIPYPPDKGDKLRMFYTIKHLSGRGHQVDVVTFLDNSREARHVEELQKYCRTVTTVCRCLWRSYLKTAWYVTKDLPISLGHFYSARFRRAVEEKLAGGYDLIIVFSSTMAQYVENYGACPKILDLVDADSEKWLQYARYAPWWKAFVYRLEGLRLREYEKKIARSFQVCTVVAAPEKEVLRDIIPAQKLHVVSNGFNYRPEHGETEKKEDSPSLLFIGGMFYFAYIDGMLDFRRRSLPLIREVFPETELYIVGADPAPSIKRLAQDPRIKVTGHVPRVLPYLRKAWVYVVPLRMAPGLQNKILEAMACGIPVVSTSIALAGIDAVPGEDVLVADDPREFAAAVIRLLGDAELRRRLGERGRRVVRERYNWEKNLGELDRIIARLRGEREG